MPKKKQTKCKQCKLKCIGKYCQVCLSTCFRCTKLIENTSKKMIKCDKCLQEYNQLTSKQKKKDYALVKNYGITYNEYEEILKQQDNKCYMCRRLPAKVNLSVDHKHKPKEKQEDLRLRRTRVRGALCYPCNKALGILRDHELALSNGAKYVIDWPAQDVLRRRDAN